MSWDQILIATVVVAVVAFLAAVNIYFGYRYGFIKWLGRWLGTRKKVIAIIMGWSLFVAVVIIREYWLSYIRNPILFDVSFYWFENPKWIAHLDFWDFLLIFLSSAVVGALLIDIETILFATITNTILSFVFPVVYVTFFIWVVLGWGNQFNLVGGFLRWGQYVVWDSIRIVFRMTFPLVELAAFFGVFLGAFVRVYFQPSAES